MHRKLKIWAIVSTVIALILLGLLLKTISVPSGGGEFVHSPDGQFVAQASSLANGNPIASGRTYYEFTLRRGNGVPPFKRIVMYPSEQNDPMYFRELDKIIVWSTNSEDVTFTIPGMSLKVDVRDHQWPM